MSLARRPASRAADRVGAAGRAASTGLARLADLALPPSCVGCEAEGSALCAACEEGLQGRRGVAPGTPVGMPSHVPLPLVAHEWCVGYAGIGRPAIHVICDATGAPEGTGLERALTEIQAQTARPPA